MKTIQEQIDLLEDTKKYYNEDVNRRCRDENECAYSGNTLGKKSDGCAVGRLLTPEKRLELDKKGQGVLGYSTVKQVWNDIPKEIQDYGQNFLGDLQDFHDNQGYWDEKGITQLGKNRFEIIMLDIKRGRY